MSQLFFKKLDALSSVTIAQKRENIEIFFGVETSNRYVIKDERNEVFGYCAEQAKGIGGFLLLQFLGHWRPFDLLGVDNSKQSVFRARHPFRVFFQRLDVFDSQDRFVGALQQRFSFLSKKFDLLDSQGRVLMQVRSPIWKIWTFPFKKQNREVAVVRKQWWGLLQEVFSDADNFQLQFSEPDALSLDEKLVLLAGAIFIDLLYFETKS